MSQRQHAIITIDPPLPCGMVKPDGLCGQPAPKGRIRQTAKSAGQWTITPICRDCSLAAMSVLWGGAATASSTETDPASRVNRNGASAPTPASTPNVELLRQRYVVQLMSQNADEFEDFAFWGTQKQAVGHILMTVSSNPRVKAGRVFDQVEKQVVGDVHYKR